MKCPYCRHPQTQTYNTRPTRFSAQIWRRRRCLGCLQTFTTYETPHLGFLTVTKQNNSTQPYLRAKLTASLHAAFPTTPKPSSLTDITDNIESQILDILAANQTLSISSQDIALLALTTLHHFDTGAFLRYLGGQTGLTTHPQIKRLLKGYQG